MNPINRNQQERNHQDLRGAEAVRKIKELVAQSSTCFFRTLVGANGVNAARPMGVREVDGEGNLWFLSANDSHKNKQIAANSAVELYFQGSQHAEFLQLSCRASVSNDRTRIKALWHPIIKTWFTAGVDDPRISVLKLTPIDGYYWDTKHGIAVAGIKMLIGAAIGKTMDDSIQGSLHV